MNKCLVAGCAWTKASWDNIYALPKEPSRRKEWLEVLNIGENQKIRACWGVCTAHFKNNQFAGSSRLRLKSNAVPFLPPNLDTPAKILPVSANFATSFPNVRVLLTPLPSTSTSNVSTATTTNQIDFSTTSLSVSQSSAPELIQSLIVNNMSNLFPEEECIKVEPEEVGPYITDPLSLTDSGGMQQDQNRTSLEQRSDGIPPLYTPVLQMNQPRFHSGIQIQPALGSEPLIGHIIQQQQPNLVNTATVTQLSPPVPPFKYVYLGTGANGLPCVAQIPVSQISKPQVQVPVVNTIAPKIAPIAPVDSHYVNTINNSQSVLSAPVNVTIPSSIGNWKEKPLKPKSNLGPNNLARYGTSKTVTISIPCIMCNKMIPSSPTIIPNDDRQKILKNLLKILNWNENDLAVGVNRSPFCLICFRQVAFLVEVYDELQILQERFDSLKKTVILGLTKSFCQRKAEEENDETIKGLYEGASICHKLIDELSEPKSRILNENQMGNNKRRKGEVDVDESEQPQRRQRMDFEFDDDDFEMNVRDQPMSTIASSEDPVFALSETTGEFEICSNEKKITHPNGSKKIPPNTRLRRRRRTASAAKNIRGKDIPRSGRATSKSSLVVCPICDEILAPKAYLSEHMNIVHKGAGAKPYQCTTCSKSFPSSYNLTVHHQACHMGIRRSRKKKMVNCPICDKKIHQSSLQGHINIHTGANPYKCTSCSKSFARSSNLYDHIRLRHTQKVHFTKNNYFCDLCEKFYLFKTRYVNHILAEHSSVINVASDILYFYNCDYDGCLKSFRQKDQLNQHLGTHDNDNESGPYACPSCEKVFASSENYECHRLKLHSANIENVQGSGADLLVFECKYCPQIFENENEWKEHESKHGIDMACEHRTYLCDECGRSFKLNNQLDLHRRCVHKYKKHNVSTPGKETGDSKRVERMTIKPPICLVCQCCGKSSFKSKSVLTNHLLDDHTYENKLKCYICQQHFKKLFTLETHIRRHLNQPRKTANNPCVYCQEQFSTIHGLREHCIKQHGDQYLVNKPFHCTLCWLSLSTQEELSDHYRNRHEAWKCKTCGKELANRFRFEEHSRIHSGEKPHKCKMCDKAFSAIGNLNEHEMRHKGMKPHICEHCHVGFFRKNKLQEHIEMIHN